MPILVQWAEALAAKLREVGPAITTWLIEKLQILFEWVQQNGPALLEFVRGLGEWLWKAAQIGWQGLTWLITKAREIASVFMEVVWPAIVDFATMVRDTFVPILVEEFGGAADSASGFIRSLAEAVAGFLNTLTQNLPSLAETFGEFVRSWKDAFLPVVEQLVQELLPQFLAIAQALVPVILDLANALLPVMDFIGGITKSGLAPLMRIIEPLSEGNYMKAAAAFVTAPQYGSYNTLRMGYQGAESVAQGMQQRGQRQAQYQAAMATINNNIYLDGRRVAQTVNNQNQIASRECSRF
jgi:phage-related protein